MGGNKMEEILLEDLRKQMNIKYRFLSFIFQNYTLYIYKMGTKTGFDWKNGY